jgi:hypothetical protein
MPDPRLVTRAQRAATMLERAWERWRTAHGLAAEPLPPVSSYVGYSIEEPWGRPRVVFGVAAEEAERLAAFLQDSLDRGDDADDGGQWPPARGGVPAGPAGAERGNLFEDVRGRIPVQSWPEFSESREQLNSASATGPAAARPGAVAPGPADAPHGDSGPATVVVPAGAEGPDDAERPDGGPASRTDAGVAEDDLRYDDDDAAHAAWLSGIRASGDADDDEYCDTADDLRATPQRGRPAQAGADATDRTSRNGASGGRDTGNGVTGPGEAPAAGAGPADTGVIGWPSSAGLAHAPRPPAAQPHDDGPPGSADPGDGEPRPGPFQGRADESQSGGPQPGKPRPGGPENAASGAPGQPGDGAVDRPQDGPTAADVPADLASRASLTDTMAAELAGWAAGELPGQASARLAAWASVGGAVARGRQRARGGGSTAAERVR